MYTKLITYYKLGLHNLIWVISYRLALKAGLVTRNMKIGSEIRGPFFENVSIDINDSLESVETKVFGWCDYFKKEPPVWHKSIISGKLANVQNQHWSKISDFDLNVGDIKGVWDLSRFDFLMHFCIEYIKTGNKTHLTTLNLWLEDWSQNNPVNLGINWKCGQEASFRVMHLAVACLLLRQQKKLSPAVIQFLEEHLARISPTVIYAMAQDNNHGTSEAIALYIGGLLLEHNSYSTTQALKWKKQGRYWIENRVKRIIMNDGSFSQHSVNYHRVMLDSMCLAEMFRDEFQESNFSRNTINKLRLAIDWLRCFTDENSGDAPNLGANDGARLIPLSNTRYRDYRPTVQLASVLFYKKKCYSENGSYDQPLILFALKSKDVLPELASSKNFVEGGYVYIANEYSRLFMRYPKFQFRPSQCDVFHLDFWLKGENKLRDAGSFSYNTDKSWLDYFPSTQAHNTVQFDDREQMPKLSRFLYGGWLRTKQYTEIFTKTDSTCFKAKYVDSETVNHSREISLSAQNLTIIDDVYGFKKKAILRWRLAPGEYKIEGSTVNADDFSLTVTANVDIKRVELVDGWESRFYMKKTRLPVLEVEVTGPSKIISKLNWNK